MDSSLPSASLIHRLIHLLESEKKEFWMDHRNVGEVVIRRLEFASSVSESENNDCHGRLLVRHEDTILEEGTQLGLGEVKRLRILFSAGLMGKCRDERRAVERRIRFTFLLSDTSKEESKKSKVEKTIVKTQTFDIRVVVHRGLSINRIFLPRDGMLRAIEGQGTCVDVSNLSGEDIEICQDLALEHDAEAGEDATYLVAKASGTKEFLLKLPKSYEKRRQGDLFLRWRTKGKGRRGEIKLLGAPASKAFVDLGTTYAADKSPFRFCYPCTGTVTMVSGEGRKVHRKDCKSFEVKVSSHLRDACSVSFDIRCLCEDGSTVSSNDVILTGVLSFSNLEIPANAKDHRICKFGACFLSPGVYNFVLCQKSPSDVLYTDKKEILVE